MTLFQVVGPIFLLGGVPFIIQAVRVQRTRRHAWAHWPQVRGTVLEDDLDSLRTGTVASIAFTTVDGVEMVAHTDSSVPTGRYADGEQVPVFYDPEDPTRIVTHVHVGDSSILPVLTVGLLCCGLGLIVTWLAYR